MAVVRRVKSYLRTALGLPQRVVDDGWVWCPKTGNVRVEDCMHCSRLVEADLTADPPWISCKDPAEDLQHLWKGG